MKPATRTASKHFGGKPKQLGVHVFVCPARKTGLETSMLNEFDDFPVIFRCHLRQEQPRLVAEFYHQAVAADVYLTMLTLEKAREMLSSWEIDTRKAARELGFVSQVAFADGARQTYEWYRKKGD